MAALQPSLCMWSEDGDVVKDVRYIMSKMSRVQQKARLKYRNAMIQYVDVDTVFNLPRQRIRDYSMYFREIPFLLNVPKGAAVFASYLAALDDYVVYMLTLQMELINPFFEIFRDFTPDRMVLKKDRINIETMIKILDELRTFTWIRIKFNAQQKKILLAFIKSPARCITPSMKIDFIACFYDIATINTVVMKKILFFELLNMPIPKDYFNMNSYQFVFVLNDVIHWCSNFYSKELTLLLKEELQNCYIFKYSLFLQDLLDFAKKMLRNSIRYSKPHVAVDCIWLAKNLYAFSYDSNFWNHAAMCRKASVTLLEIIEIILSAPLIFIVKCAKPLKKLNRAVFDILTRNAPNAYYTVGFIVVNYLRKEYTRIQDTIVARNLGDYFCLHSLPAKIDLGSLPEKFLDPITKFVMYTPVKLPHTEVRIDISTYYSLKIARQKCPFTGNDLPMFLLPVNAQLKRELTAALRKALHSKVNTQRQSRS